ncbi:hypothetical protein ACFW81_06715 [Streptomyces angustmyceticus]|uniref:hypothetical protein n=1 Tax=Streptomyces angustmyceticus TaxID=285578 RepID=UPI00367EB0B8
MTITQSSRAWTVTISSLSGLPMLSCSACPVPAPVGSAVVRAVRRHLVHHLMECQVPEHLRTCQCRDRSCVWHRRQGPCAGRLRLVLIRADGGRTWHLADSFDACAAAIPHCATVPEPPLRIAATPGAEAPVVADLAEEPLEWFEAQW